MPRARPGVVALARERGCSSDVAAPQRAPAAAPCGAGSLTVSSVAPVFRSGPALRSAETSAWPPGPFVVAHTTVAIPPLVNTTEGVPFTNVIATFTDNNPNAQASDFNSGGGGVTVSYYEWVQDQNSFFWSENQINETLEQTMNIAFNSVHATAQRYNTDMRTGAYILAVDRVAEATSVRGIFP